ncbi:GntR family transcriptional regulator [Oscillibacter hominis]|uniref:GntR family transcriptional regulator n=1 Tax=Oscillibacter hominis TaxID=2763056 RepID=A0A7G9B504_9FIRM|nr:GntR family transcriptional regulator [Oscillibacter hominis]QNL44635.1 GntR family transcriptional regulator [Oscillibacter hominis]
MSRKDEAYRYLRNAIVTNRYPQNAPISEMAVSEELGMSRTPITPYDVEEIYELRVLLEVWALGRSFSRITPAELDHLEEMFRQGYERSDWELLHEADRSLHGLITEKAGSKRLLEFISVLNAQIERIRSASALDKNRSSLSYEEHLEIIRCIRAGDREKSLRALRAHLRSVANSAIESAKYNEVNGKYSS